jgi:hypothetical protein
MRRERKSSDEFTCWLCDYGWILPLFLVVLMGGWQVRGLWVPAAVPLVGETPLSPILTGTVTAVPIVTALSPTPGPATTTPPPAYTPTTEMPALPQYIVVMVPLNWQGDRASFEAAAREEIAYFSTESDIDRYFALEIKLVEDNMTDADLTSNTLLYDMVEFAAQREPADRYIGLTDGDLSLDGEASITGWTAGPNSLGVMGEANAHYVIAHELGHTYGLCDEYNYAIWQEQDQEFQDGCPNPFPAECEQTPTNEISCLGAPTEDGRNSIMGPSGLDGAYGFNTPGLNHLLEVFAELARLY